MNFLWGSWTIVNQENHV